MSNILNNAKKEINFTGKEYLEYLKYKDKKPKIQLKKETKIGLFVLGGILIFAITILLVIDMVTPNPLVEPFIYTWEGIGMFLAVCAGLGWLFHGTGFLLVRR